MKNLTKLALTLAAAGGVCYLFKDKIKNSKAYQTVESNESVKKAKAAASDSYHKVKDSEQAQKAKETIKDTYHKVKDSDTVKKAKDSVSETYDKIKDTIKDKVDHPEDADREYFTLHEHDADETSAASSESSKVSEEETAKAVTEAVAETEDVIAEATGAVAQAADSNDTEVIGDEYMGLSDTSEDPSVLEEQDKLDV